MNTSLPTTMRAAVHRRYGPPDVLAVEDVPVPEPRPGEALLRVRAVAVTAADAAFRSARPFVARTAAGLVRPRRAVLGSEFAGDVVAVGEGLDPRAGLAPGTRVVGASGVEMGGYAEYARVPAANLVPIPDDLPYADAVAVVEGGLTAFPFLRDHGKVRPGQAVCVNGASGAVGVAAVQLAVHLGAEVTAVCSGANEALVRSLGATEVVDYTRADFTAARNAFDVVLDAVGTSSFRRCRRALRPGGVYLTTVPSVAIMVQMLRSRLWGSRTAGIAFTGLRSADAKRADTHELLGLAAAGRLRPVVHEAYALDGVVSAHRLVDTGRKRGAALLLP